MLKILPLITLFCFLGNAMHGIGNSFRTLNNPDLYPLPPVSDLSPIDFTKILSQRRSIRAFLDWPLTDQEISQLLFAAQGISDERRGLRTAPSAGATYPLNVYLLTAKGLWQYLPTKHALKPLQLCDLRKQLCTAALGQDAIQQAPATIIFTATFQRTTNRYGERGVRYVHFEIGHAAQNVHLMAVVLGLGSVPIGAFDDRKVVSILNLPKEESVLYLIPVGRPK